MSKAVATAQVIANRLGAAVVVAEGKTLLRIEPKIIPFKPEVHDEDVRREETEPV